MFVLFTAQSAFPPCVLPHAAQYDYLRERKAQSQRSIIGRQQVRTKISSPRSYFGKDTLMLENSYIIFPFSHHMHVHRWPKFVLQCSFNAQVCWGSKIRPDDEQKNRNTIHKEKFCILCKFLVCSWCLDSERSETSVLGFNISALKHAVLLFIIDTLL